MREIDRLRPLQMRVAGDEDIRVASAQLHQGALKHSQLAQQADGFLTQPEPHVERDLVVARAPGVKLRARRHAPCQRGLDVHVDIFQLQLPLKAPGSDFFCNRFQPLDNRAQLPTREQPGFAEHCGMGH